EVTKRLKGYSKAYYFSIIYKVILYFKYLLRELEREVKLYKVVNYNTLSALEDYLTINIRVA
ncbi:hypothetical protein GQ44DRAFT_632702, partial [Phaeosphaeriaceae sp. PMI808]